MMADGQNSKPPQSSSFILGIHVGITTGENGLRSNLQEHLVLPQLRLEGLTLRIDVRIDVNVGRGLLLLFQGGAGAQNTVSRSEGTPARTRWRRGGSGITSGEGPEERLWAGKAVL